VRGFSLGELFGLYALVIGLGSIIAAAFLVSVPLGLLAVGAIGTLLGTTMLYLAAVKQATVEAEQGNHLRRAA
jgi:hypothetical protein